MVISTKFSTGGFAATEFFDVREFLKKLCNIVVKYALEGLVSIRLEEAEVEYL